MFTESGSVDQSGPLLLPLDARQLARDKGCGLVREGEGEEREQGEQLEN